ncbi:Zinc knuckle family protein, partial [Aphelenchoides avenae]
MQQMTATKQRAAPGAATSPLVLTELPIEPFGGDIRQFPAFRNRFLDIVESYSDLQPRHKLQYLLQYLRGEPHRFAGGLQLTDANYFVVVLMLQERYGDKDMLRNLLLAEFINLRPPSDEVADLFRFHDEAFRVTSELKQLGDDVDASRVYEQVLMGRLSEKLRFKLIQNYDCDREKTVSAILNGLRRYVTNRQMAMNSGIQYKPPSPAVPPAPCRERRHSPPPPARSPSECSTEESTECSKDINTKQPTERVATTVIANIIDLLERWRCQLCGDPHVAANCTTYATFNRRLRRARKLGLCLHCLNEGHRAGSCPREGTDLCQICRKGNHHRALCTAAANGTVSEPLRRSSKCATCGSPSDRKRSVPKRHTRMTHEEPTVTSVVDAARKPRRSGTQRIPERIADNPNKRHATVTNAVHRSDSRRAKSTAPKNVPPSAPRQDRKTKPRASPAREEKPRASPRTHGPSVDGTNSRKIYRNKRSGNAGTSSKGRGSTTRPLTTSTDESKQKDVVACDMERRLTALETFFATANCSTSRDPPLFDRERDRSGSCVSSVYEPDATGHEQWDEDESYPDWSGHCSNAPSQPFDATSEDDNRFPTYKEVRAYVASASTNDAHAPLHECLEVTAANPVSGAMRKAIVFFDSGSDFSYTAPTLARDLDLPLHGKCVLRVTPSGLQRQPPSKDSQHPSSC